MRLTPTIVVAIALAGVLAPELLSGLALLGLCVAGVGVMTGAGRVTATGGTLFATGLAGTVLAAPLRALLFDPRFLCPALSLAGLALAARAAVGLLSIRRPSVRPAPRRLARRLPTQPLARGDERLPAPRELGVFDLNEAQDD